MEHVKGSAPLTFRILSPHQSGLFIEHIFIITCPFHKKCIIVILAKFFSQLSCTIIIISTFQRQRYRFLGNNIEREIPILFINVCFIMKMRSCQRFFNQIICTFLVNARKPFQTSLYYDRNSMITNHTMRLFSP